MTYPAGIAALTVKTDGPDQPILAAHPNALKTALDEVRSVIGDTPQGTVADLQTRLAVLLGTDGKLKSQTGFRFVGKSGCEYSTIQAAVTAASSGETIFVFPGTYTETVTTKGGVQIAGLGMIPGTDTYEMINSQVIIQAPANQNAIIFSGGGISNLTILGVAAQPAIVGSNTIIALSHVSAYTDGGVIIAHSSSNGIHASFCRFASMGEYVLSLNGGNHFLEYSVVDPGEEHDPIQWVGASTIYAQFCRIASGDAGLAIPSGSTFFARLCAINGALSGAGTINVGTMSGSCTDTYYGGMF